MLNPQGELESPTQGREISSQQLEFSGDRAKPNSGSVITFLSFWNNDFPFLIYLH